MEFNEPQLFINRELSWLAFNERVLDDARSRELPLYERLKFFAIASSNLDEFFMVRVAGLKQQQASGVAETAADGLLPAEQLSAISERVHALVEAASRLWVEELHPGLLAAGVSLLTRDKLTAEQKAAARTHFTTSVFPALTPLAVDPGHPFPHLRNKSLNVAVLLRREGPKRRRNVHGTSLAVVQVPSVLRRLVPVPAEKGTAFLLLGELIALCAADLFPGYVVEHAAAFRVTRNWDLNVDDEESEDLLSTIQEELRRRDRGAAVRLELDASARPQMESLLTAALKLGPMDVYRQQSPLQPSDLMALTELDARPELRVEPFTPTVPPVLRDVESILHVVAERDLLLHHPYESFDPVVRFLEEAAEDPDVLAIKQTLYRTSGDSPIARALSRAVENGKQVAVLVEIKARLDEANNIAWARKMEESGVHVVYGLIGLKTHAKVALVVRREGQGIRRYVHLGTGNYNPHTARLYTDLSLFTSRAEMADDVSALFNMLTGYAVAPQWKRLAVAPMGLQEKVLALIQREADKARRGEPARIVAKMNSLVDATVIRALYAASQAGVEIELLVRGICCLRPGVPGVSERIRVTSVVDRFLEHSRVFAFGAGSQPEVWMSSADWMPRNFLRRIETMFPVEDPAIRQRLLDEVLGVSLKDNVKARRLQVDGTYLPVGRDGTVVRSQGVLMELARRNNQPDPKPLQALRHATAPDAPIPPRQVPQTGS
ncbi:polyphosphate kinase 1 [Archangium lansingense]|uniref:Polyphosphate kinase n=1 Tax=Archangium lansingense TaxID=2995310 RepID=A0ABT4ALL2_9BACT|nr:polyphosphate kinase 1 [Archangium lansinium]MCY1081697.1 polyphosphate kinase 1 [Archangium lansinium]